LALEQVVAQHSTLDIGVLSASARQPSWIRLADIDLASVVRFETNGNTKKLMQQEHSRPFKDAERKPLWRLVVNVLDEPQDEDEVVIDVGFFFSHAISDGKGGVAFHASLLSALQNLLSSTASNSNPARAKVHNSTTITPLPLPLLPAMETVISLTITPWHMVSTLIGTLMPAPTGLWTGPPITCPASGLPMTNISTLYTPADTATKISNLCRTNKTSVTALITVLIARILASTYPSSTLFSAAIAISLRRFFPTISDRDMVAYTSAVSLRFSSSSSCNPSQPLNWDAVRDCKRQIDAVAGSPKNQYSAFLKLLGDFRGFLLKKVGKARDASFEVSNLGLVDLDDIARLESGKETKVRCERLLFSQSANVTGTAYVFSIVTLKNREMGIACSWQEGILNESEVAGVMSRIEKDMGDLVL
jgi:hypothetical protein